MFAMWIHISFSGETDGVFMQLCILYVCYSSFSYPPLISPDDGLIGLPIPRNLLATGGRVPWDARETWTLGALEFNTPQQ